jgi:hypothetical protein
MMVVGATIAVICILIGYALGKAENYDPDRAE